jgi:hypothetical protein
MGDTVLFAHVTWYWRQLRRAAEKKRLKDTEAKAIAKDFEQALSHYTHLEE